MLNSPPTGFRLDVTLTLALAALLATAGCIRLPANDGSGANAANAEEWANCNMKASCESSVKVAPSTGMSGSNGLEWHTKGKDWKGFGWNWFGFYPEDAGTDVTKYQNLVFWIRVKSAPDGNLDL